MEENKNLENLEAEETVEAVEEATDEIVEEAVEETTEETVDTCGCAECHEEPEVIKKSSKLGAIIAVIVAIVVVAAAVITSNMEFNKYNKMGYLNVSGTTVGEQIAYANMTLEDFLEQGGLPKDMAEDTYWDVAIALMPMENFSQLMFNSDFETVKIGLGLPEAVTAQTTFGEAQDMMTVKEYFKIDEEGLAALKAQYALDEAVTLDTPWKEIRVQVEKVQLEQRLAKEKEAAEAAKAAEEEADVPAEDEEVEAPVDDAVEEEPEA